MFAYELENLSYTYNQQKTPANRNISLTIEEGEFFGLLGDNGAGKSTLVKQLANLIKPTSGTLRLFGKSLDHSMLYTSSQVGYMPQGAHALNNTTVGEMLYFTAHLRGLSHHDARAERDCLLKMFELEALRDRPMPKLSGGQRRLVLLATTISAGRPVVILDEPTNDLDPQNRLHVWEVLRKINAERGTTIILVTHNVMEAEKVIQRVGIMRAGQLVALGRPGVLKAELNMCLNLEIVFSPDSPPLLPHGVIPREIAPGRWQISIERHAAAEYVQLLSQTPSVEDFRVGTATLEDLYMSMVEHQ